MQELNEIKKAVDAFMAKAESFIEANKVSEPDFRFGQDYWFLDSVGDIRKSLWYNSRSDQDRLARANVYLTIEAAELADDQKVAETRYLNRIAELNRARGFVPKFDGFQENVCFDSMRRGEHLGFWAYVSDRARPLSHYFHPDDLATIKQEFSLADLRLIYLGERE